MPKRNPFEKFLKSEDLLHRAILDYIRLQFPQAVIAHVANEGKRSKFEQFKIKWLGISSGVPDIMVFTPGKKYIGLAIEVKAKGKKPSENQIKWIENLQKCGWMAIVADDFSFAKAHTDLYFKA